MNGECEGMPITVLFVDDEENILRSLKRLTMDEPFETVTATSGEEGLRFLAENRSVGVVVSDQRMPGMTGVEFLAKSRELAPEALRIVLTGYADITATMDAINRGGAYRYVTKPWQDTEFLQTIRDAVEHCRVLRENRRLQELVNRQNEELKEWNGRLKERVLEQTAQIRKRNEDLHAMNERLRDNFHGSIRAFAGLIELRDREVRNHSHNVAELSVSVAKLLKISAAETDKIGNAALLHDIGKIGMSDDLLAKDPERMSPRELQQYMLHSVRGQTAIDGVEELRDCGVLIRHHHEYFNGTGFPDRLAGEAIPLGARIIGMADFVDRAISRLTGSDVLEYAIMKLREEVGRRFDPALAEVTEACVRNTYAALLPPADMVETELKPRDLKEGMVTARDVVSGTGLLLLSKGSVLDEQKIHAIKRYYYLDPANTGVFVLMKR